MVYNSHRIRTLKPFKTLCKYLAVQGKELFRNIGCTLKNKSTFIRKYTFFNEEYKC